MINPYDPCAANKWTDGGQLTVLCNVNNMLIPHKNKKEVTKFIEYMREIYGEEMPVARGKKHTYVGMDLYYNTPGEVIVSMDSYITEVIDEFPKEMMKSIKTPTGNHLFKVGGACKNYVKETRSSSTGWWPISSSSASVHVHTYNQQFRSSRRE